MNDEEEKDWQELLNFWGLTEGSFEGYLTINCTERQTDEQVDCIQREVGPVPEMRTPPAEEECGLSKGEHPG